MSRFIAARFGQALVTLLLMTVIVFLLARIVGDPIAALLPPEASPAERAALRSQLGLDRPLLTQYWEFLSQLSQFRFGDSLYYRQPVLDLIRERAMPTLALAFTSTAFALVLALPTAVIAARRRDSWFDRAAMALSIVGQSAPVFWLGIILIELFAVHLRWLPASGNATPEAIILPAVALGAYSFAGLFRLLRSGMLDVLDEDYIVMARATGLPEYTIVGKYALRVAVLPMVTFMSVFLLSLITGAVVTETAFAWPGLGNLVVGAVANSDFPLTQGIVMLLTVAFLIGNLLVDIAYAAIDPRIRL